MRVVFLRNGRVFVRRRPLGKSYLADVNIAVGQLARIVVTVVKSEPNFDVHSFFRERRGKVERVGFKSAVGRCRYVFDSRYYVAVRCFENERRAVTACAYAVHSHIDGELVCFVDRERDGRGLIAERGGANRRKQKNVV